MGDDASHVDDGGVASRPAVSPLVVVVTTDPAHQGLELRGREDVPLVVVGIESHVVVLGEILQILRSWERLAVFKWLIPVLYTILQHNTYILELMTFLGERMREFLMWHTIAKFLFRFVYFELPKTCSLPRCSLFGVSFYHYSGSTDFRTILRNSHCGSQIQQANRNISRQR